MLEFDPNDTTPRKLPEYATYIPSRSPNFKMHKQKKHAANALSCGAGADSPGILYQNIDGKWIEIDRFEPPTECAHCGGNFQQIHNEMFEEYKKTSTSRYVYNTYRARVVYDDAIKPAYKQKKVCNRCYNEHFTYNSPHKLDPSQVGRHK